MSDTDFFTHSTLVHGVKFSNASTGTSLTTREVVIRQVSDGKKIQSTVCAARMHHNRWEPHPDFAVVVEFASGDGIARAIRLVERRDGERLAIYACPTVLTATNRHQRTFIGYCS